MFISVIIPTRNRYDYVNLLIDDLLKQDISNFEIVVVDQSEAPQPISRCEHILTQTLGPCVSRNIGSKKAKGDILVFLDDDARIYSDFIREITSPIIKRSFDVVAGAVCNTKGDYTKSNKDYLKLNSENFIKVLTTNPDGPESRVSMAFPAGCSAILKDLFNEVKGFNENFDPTGAGEDRNMALNLFRLGHPIWYNANAKLLHAQASDGGSRDVGSRTLMLDVHTYIMCKEHFSVELANNLKNTILNKYKKNFLMSLLKLGNIRTKYIELKQIKKMLNLN